jgi:hypothetical protein
MDELVKELLQLQIRQTEIIGQLLQPNAANGNTGPRAEPRAEPQVVPPDDADRPLQVGDQVRVLNPNPLQPRRSTVYTVVKIGKLVTSVSPTGSKIVRAAHNLVRV